MLATLRSARRRVGAFIGGFEAGLSSRRLKGFQPSRAHLNSLIAAAGPDITARARWLIRNNGYAANAIESWAGNVVGAGIKPSSLIKDAKVKEEDKDPEIPVAPLTELEKEHLRRQYATRPECGVEIGVRF